MPLTLREDNYAVPSRFKSGRRMHCPEETIDTNCNCLGTCKHPCIHNKRVPKNKRPQLFLTAFAQDDNAQALGVEFISSRWEVLLGIAGSRLLATVDSGVADRPVVPRCRNVARVIHLCMLTSKLFEN